MTQIKIVNLSALFIATLMISILTGGITNNFALGLSPLVLFWVFVGSQLLDMSNKKNKIVL